MCLIISHNRCVPMLSSHFVLLTLTEAINHSFICTLILHKNSPWAQIRKEKKAWTYQYEDKKTVKAMGGQILIMSSLWFGIIKSCSTASACKTHAGQPTKKKKEKESLNHLLERWSVVTMTTLCVSKASKSMTHGFYRLIKPSCTTSKVTSQHTRQWHSLYIIYD